MQRVANFRHCAIPVLCLVSAQVATVSALCGMQDNILAALTVSDGPLCAHLREPVIYVPRSKPSQVANRTEHLVSATFNGKEAVEGYFDDNGTPVKLSILSSDPTILEVRTSDDTEAEIEKLKATSLNGDNARVAKIKIALLEEQLQIEKKIGGVTFRFLKPGNVSIRVAVGMNKVDLPVRVIKAPIEPGDSSDQVVQTLGLPNQKSQLIVSWPRSETRDGIHYGPSASEQVLKADHWRYDKYPGLVISIVDGSVHAINSYSTTDMLLDLRNKEQRRLIDEKTKKEQAAVLAEREAKFRKWTSSNGSHSVEALLASYANGFVTLEKRDGTRVRVELTKLSDSDKAFVKQWRQRH
jgi:hypothetical protein